MPTQSVLVRIVWEMWGFVSVPIHRLPQVIQPRCRIIQEQSIDWLIYER